MRVLVAGLVLLPACDSPPDFDGLRMSATVTYGGGELTAEAHVTDLSLFGTADPELDVSVEVHGERIELGFASYDAGYRGRGTLASPLAADEEVVVIVDQRDGDHAELIANAPTPFALTPPANANSWEPLTVTWTPTASDVMSWHGETCMSLDDNGPIPKDIGSLTFPPGVLAFEYSGCGVTLTFERARRSFPDSSFRFADMTVVQSATTLFRIAGAP